MEAVSKVLKISSKGQVTIPKAIRDLLKTNLIVIVAEHGHIRLEPAPSAAGMLHKYARPGLSFKKARALAWEEAMREKHGYR